MDWFLITQHLWKAYSFRGKLSFLCPVQTVVRGPCGTWSWSGSKVAPGNCCLMLSMTSGFFGAGFIRESVYPGERGPPPHLLSSSAFLGLIPSSLTIPRYDSATLKPVNVSPLWTNRFYSSLGGRQNLPHRRQSTNTILFVDFSQTKKLPIFIPLLSTLSLVSVGDKIECDLEVCDPDGGGLGSVWEWMVELWSTQNLPCSDPASHFPSTVNLLHFIYTGLHLQKHKCNSKLLFYWYPF